MNTIGWVLNDDDVLGPSDVHVDRAGGVIEIHPGGEPAGPSARLSRSGDGPLDDSCLIGSREAGRLSLRVGDSDAAIRPGPGRVLRRSYRVDVRLGGVHYRLVPVGSRASVLMRDGVRIGRLEVDQEVMVVVAGWTPGADVRPVDAALGYLLALAFGAGSTHPAYLLFEFVTNLVPG